MFYLWWYRESPRNEWSLVFFPLLWTGVQSYGTVDELPGQFHVATRFFHLYGVPILPLSSYVLDARDGAGRPISIRLKSILFAWIRMALVIVAIPALVAAIGGMALIAQGHGWATVRITVLGCLIFATAVLSLRVAWRFQRATNGQAAKLAAALGYSPDAAVEIVELGDDIDQGLDETDCVECGRTIAASTKICPRCEARQW